MTEFNKGPFEPGIYTKGDSVKRADSAREAVAAVFDGYVRQPDATPVETEAVATDEGTTVREDVVSDDLSGEAPIANPTPDLLAHKVRGGLFSR